MVFFFNSLYFFFMEYILHKEAILVAALSFPSSPSYLGSSLSMYV